MRVTPIELAKAHTSTPLFSIVSSKREAKLSKKKKKKKAITPFPGHCLKRLRIDYHKNEGETMRIYEAVAENTISGAILKMKFEAEDDEAAHEKIDSLNNIFERYCEEGVIIVELLESEEGEAK